MHTSSKGFKPKRTFFSKDGASPRASFKKSPSKNFSSRGDGSRRSDSNSTDKKDFGDKSFSRGPRKTFDGARGPSTGRGDYRRKEGEGENFRSKDSSYATSSDRPRSNDRKDFRGGRSSGGASFSRDGSTRPRSNGGKPSFSKSSDRSFAGSSSRFSKGPREERRDGVEGTDNFRERPRSFAPRGDFKDKRTGGYAGGRGNFSRDRSEGGSERAPRRSEGFSGQARGGGEKSFTRDRQFSDIKPFNRDDRFKTRDNFRHDKEPRAEGEARHEGGFKGKPSFGDRKPFNRDDRFKRNDRFEKGAPAKRESYADRGGSFSKGNQRKDDEGRPHQSGEFRPRSDHRSSGPRSNDRRPGDRFGKGSSSHESRSFKPRFNSDAPSNDNDGKVSSFGGDRPQRSFKRSFNDDRSKDRSDSRSYAPRDNAERKFSPRGDNAPRRDAPQRDFARSGAPRDRFNKDDSSSRFRKDGDSQSRHRPEGRFRRDDARGSKPGFKKKESPISHLPHRILATRMDFNDMPKRRNDFQDNNKVEEKGELAQKKSLAVE